MALALALALALLLPLHLHHACPLLSPGTTASCLICFHRRHSSLADCRSVIDEIGDGAEEVDLGGRSIAMRAYASWFNFKGADQQKSVGVLSGGERNRLQLAKVCIELCSEHMSLRPSQILVMQPHAQLDSASHAVLCYVSHNTVWSALAFGTFA